MPQTQRKATDTISPTLREALTKAENGAKSEYVVDVNRASHHNSKDFLTSYSPRIAKATGIKSFLHKLRHTYASQLVQKGVNLYLVSKLLGHSSIQMTEIYAHLVPATLQQTAMCMTPRKMPETNGSLNAGKWSRKMIAKVHAHQKSKLLGGESGFKKFQHKSQKIWYTTINTHSSVVRRT